MTFVVNGIQQKTNTTTPLQLLVVNDSALLVRKVLEKYNILVLSIKDYTQDPKLFGDVRAKIKRWFDGITVITNHTDIPSACEFFLTIGLDILALNSFSKPIPEDDVKTVLEQTAKKLDAMKEQQQWVIQAKQEQEKRIYSDPRLAGAQQVADRIFVHTEEIMKTIDSLIPAQEVKKLLSMEEDLKKLKLGNNYEKIRDLAVQIMHIMQSREDIYFNAQEAHAQTLLPDSVVTDVDLAKEEVRKLYTSKMKDLGGWLSWLKDDYAVFGNASLIRKFFQKDMIHQLAQPQKWLYYLYDLIGVCVGLLLSLTGFWMIYNMLRSGIENLTPMRTQITKLGILWLLLFAGSFLKKKNIGNLILVYGLTILAYWLITSVIIANFAL